MNVLNVQNLRKSFGTRTVFEGVSFAIDEGEKVGLIGANGSGKTTLFRIVAGEEGRNDGTIALKRGASVGYLAQEPRFQPDATIRSAVSAGHPELLASLRSYQEISATLAKPHSDHERLLARQGDLMARIDALGGWDWQHRVETMLTRVGVDAWDRPVAGLSGGEQKRVALARALLQQPDLLLLDEPTNHLDADTTLWLEEHLVEYPGAVMLITHDRYFLDRVVTRMIEVSRAELTTYPGGYTEYLEAKSERIERMTVEEQKRGKLIRQELAWVKRSPSARTGKQKARIHRLERTREAHARQQLPKQDVVDIAFGAPPRLGRTVLDLHEISKSYDDRILIEDLSTRLRAGERIGVIGPNGAGKTTLLRIILGEETPGSGAVEVGVNTRIAYYDQGREELDPSLLVHEAVSDQEWVTAGGQRTHLRSYLESFLFPSEVQSQRVASLSGGERNRLLLARLLLQEANLLILDEPTNDLDLMTLQVLESALATFPGCVLVVTHDRFFLDKVATGLLVFEGAGVVRRHEGSYDLYRRVRDERLAAAAPAKAGKPKSPEAAPRADHGTRRLSYMEKRELESIEVEIVSAEADVAQYERRLADPALYSDRPDEVEQVTLAYQEAKARAETLYARWAELEERQAG
ncbi:MAG: ABC-F family ATP-binding cassette domain-containing protein [Gemmatimonadota bacterium]